VSAVFLSNKAFPVHSFIILLQGPPWIREYHSNNNNNNACPDISVLLKFLGTAN
jgi:hypothetical protein